MGGEAEVDSATYEILDARIGPFSAGRELALQVRVTNKGRFAINFGGDPRLAVGDQLLAPASEPNEIVPAESAKEGRITFELPASSVDRGDFRVVQGAETGSIALDFSGKTGPTPASDAAARRAGGSTYSVAIDPSQAVLRFGEMTYVARSAHVHRYAHKLTLTVNVQMSNGSRYDAGLTDGEFRLVVDEEARPPADPFFKIVRADAADAVDVVFDMPLHVRHAVLRTRVGEIVKEISLQLPSFQNSTARDGTG
jgi:hypothetical protein